MALENENEEVVVDDRRAAIEAAFDSAEEATSSVVEEKPAVEEVSTTEEKPAVEEKPAIEEKPAVEEKPADEKTLNVDKPPQSWKAVQKAKWNTIEPDVRQEILRRERETTQVLHETANVRQFANKFQEIITPFRERFEELDAHPMVAIHELLKADRILSTAPPAERARYMAELISDYEIDIEQLDLALSGKGSAAPSDARLEQLLAQKIAPLQQFVSQQQAREQQVQQLQQQQIAETVETMAANTEKFPYFDQVRDSMADIIELLDKRGQQISIEAAYNKAVALDPTISEELAAKASTDQQLKTLNAENTKAKKALAASVSIAGAPQNSTKSPPAATDRRATIEAAFEALSGR
jgi:hypothetical protein